jgi:hypothetical protein
MASSTQAICSRYPSATHSTRPMADHVPGRRYVRFFKFIDAFATATRLFNSSSGITAVLDVGKWSCLGMYLFLESCTIVYKPPPNRTRSSSTSADKAQMDAMEIWSTTWAPALLLEGNKFWFYSLLFSLASCLLQLYRLRFLSNSPGRSKATSNTLLRPLAKQILTDACDLLIPGSITGWARTSPAIVGLATMVSTLLASEEIWYRVQRAAAATNVKAVRKENQVRKKGKV